jgi:hypothetical protein
VSDAARVFGQSASHSEAGTEFINDSTNHVRSRAKILLAFAAIWF